MQQELAPHQAVHEERLRRGWSIRTAASKGGMSNTAWGDIENGDRAVSPLFQRAVSTAFGWPDDWPTTMVAPAGSSVSDRITTLEESVARLTAAVDLLVAALEKQSPQPSKKAK